jgi:hypothetical protein
VTDPDRPGGQPYPGQPFPGQQAPYPPASHPQAPYPQAGYAQGPYQQQPPYPRQPPYQQQQTYQQQPPYPQRQPAPPRRGPSTGVIVGLVVAGVVLLGLLGGGVALLATRDGAPTGQTAPLNPGSPTAPPDGPLFTPPVGDQVTVTMPSVVDGQPQIDNRYAKELVDGLRQQLESNPAGTGQAVVGVFGKASSPLPAFLVAATATDQDPELVLSGVAAGMQQSAGAQELDFVDSPAGPLGGRMRCAENGAQFTACLWGTEGAFGINIVYGERLAEAAATTVRVRQVVEIHS